MIVSNEMLLEKKKEIDSLLDVALNLKRKTHKSREVTVTGPRGAIGRAIGHDCFNGGCPFRVEVEEEGVEESCWSVTLDGTEARCSSIKDLLAAEICVGGIVKVSHAPGNGVGCTTSAVV